jgi:DNA-binding transcriptional MerR regulator
MRIGELAERSGVTVRTIRYYIEEGLLPPPPRRGKYGDFDESYVQRLQLIHQFKEERLPLPEIQRRLEDMGVLTATVSSPRPLPLFPEFRETAANQPAHSAEKRREGVFRSRFAEDAGLTSDQVTRLEAAGLLQSSEGLFLSSDLPLARAAARLLSSGATLDDLADLTAHLHQEADLIRRLLETAGAADPLTRALLWAEQVRAINLIRHVLLRRWGETSEEDVQDGRD